MDSRNKSFSAMVILLNFIVHLMVLDYRNYNMQVMENPDLKTHIQ